MAFQIVSDWWGFLDKRTDGNLGMYARGETSEIHPRVDEAADFATSAVGNALGVCYPQALIDAFTPADADAEMRLHAGALAMYALTSVGGNRPAEIGTDYVEAQTWLSKVRSGSLVVKALVPPTETTTGDGDGHVQYRGPSRVMDSSSSEYAWRNPKI